MYENNIVNNDSAAAAYGKLINNYKSNPLLALVTAKYTSYETEQKNLKEAEEKKLKEANPDTTALQSSDKDKNVNDQKDAKEVQANVTQPPAQNLKKDSLDSIKKEPKSEIQNNLKNPAAIKDEKKELPGHENVIPKEKEKSITQPVEYSDTLQRMSNPRQKVLEAEKKTAAPSDTAKSKREVPKD
jgi:hypothetical protein